MADRANGETAGMSSIVARVFGLDDYGRPIATYVPDSDAQAAALRLAERRAAQPILLILAASPTDRDALRIPEELQDIKQRLRASPRGREFEVEFEPAAIYRDLVTYLLEATPTIVHFSGHGQSGGIALHDERGQARLISTDALGSLFSHPAISTRLRLVVLNSCFSEAQAATIVPHVDCVVGMRSSVPDATARAFSNGLYAALGFGQDVASAFELAKTQIGIESLSGDNIPQLVTRAGVDPSAVFPLDDRRSEPRRGPEEAPAPAQAAPVPASTGVVKVGDKRWQWEGVLPTGVDRAYDAVEQALNRMQAGRVTAVGRSRLKVGTGGLMNGRFAATEEVTVDLTESQAGTRLLISSRSTQPQVSDFGHNEANVRLVVGLLGLAER